MIGIIADWVTIIGFVITIVTLILTANVNKKVNGILKTQNDRSYFDKKIGSYLNGLKQLQDIASNAKEDVLFSTMQYSIINNAIQLVNSSWDVLMQFETKNTRKKRIQYWQKQFKCVQDMYRFVNVRDTKKLIEFLTEFITFLEKEQDYGER